MSDNVQDLQKIRDSESTPKHSLTFKFTARGILQPEKPTLRKIIGKYGEDSPK